MYVYVYAECVHVWYSRLKKYVNDSVKSVCVVMLEDCMKLILGARVYKLKKMQKQAENPRFQKGYTTKVSYEGPKNIGRHSKEISSPRQHVAWDLCASAGIVVLR